MHHRARSISVEGSKTEQAILALLYPERSYWRPKTRADCDLVDRPCPYVACRYNLYLEIGLHGSAVMLTFPGKEPDEVEHSCALDIADRGEIQTKADIAKILGITRERVRQIEARTLAKIRKKHPDFIRWYEPRWQRIFRGCRQGAA
jgi:hypothetical protein